MRGTRSRAEARSTTRCSPGRSQHRAADVAISGTVGTSVVIHAVVDPSNAIAECNDGNNSDAADDSVSCVIVE
jgi:hypothetical protein